MNTSGRASALLQAPPPARTLAWAVRQAGDEGAQLSSVSWLAGGSAHANHAITVINGGGAKHELVLRRWIRPDWQATDPDFAPQREIAALELLAEAGVPAPRLVAADVHAATCDVPTLLETRLPGGPPHPSSDLDEFCRQLAAPLPAIHAVNGRAQAVIPRYRPYVDVRTTAPPRWAQGDAWQRAWEVLAAPPPSEPGCFIHRDYHPANTLWVDGQLTAVVDWTYASWGAPGVDLGHMRWNLVLDFGHQAADRFLGHHQRLVGATTHQPYWDIRTTVDLVGDGDSHDALPEEHVAALEAHITRALGLLTERLD